MAIHREAIERLRKQRQFLEEEGAGLVLDADTHITDLRSVPSDIQSGIDSSPNYFHGRPLSAEELLQYLDHAGVDGALSWQNPACTTYPGSEKENYEALLTANGYIYESANRYPKRVFPAGWTDPRALGVEGACDLVDQLVEEFGFPIVKMNPAQNRFPIDSEEVFRVMERVDAHKGGVAFHYGADTEFTPATGLEKAAAAFPEMPIFGVHMGGGGASYLGAEKLYTESRELGLRRDNIYFIFSAKRDTHIESDLITYQLADGGARERLLCASDAPYGLPTWNFGGFRTLFRSLQQGASHPDLRLRENPDLFDEQSVAGYLGGNLAAIYARLAANVLAGHE